MTTALTTLETDDQILEAFRSGEQERAMSAFVRVHQQFVYAVALRHLRHHEDARDVTQETFLKAFKSLARFKGDSSLKTWLYRITMNTAISLQRKRKFISYFSAGEGEGEVNVPSSSLNPAEQTQQTEFERFFEIVLDTLPPKQRETFCLRYYEELSYEEISKMLGKSEGALKANYHWAVKKIAEQVRKSEYYDDWLDK